MSIRKVSAIFVASGLLSASLSCGGSDSDGSGGGAGGSASYSDISASLSKPSGTLAATNAVNVAEAYEKIGSAGADDKQVKQVSTSTMTCPAGGTQSTNTSGVTQTSVHAVVSFNNCCQQQGCCLDGDADVFYATGGEYQYCTAYDVTSTCGGPAQKVVYQGCFDETGWVYLVKVDGKSYAVTGSYANGNGTLTIKDASATWTCTYSNDKGSCTGGASTISY